MAIIGPRPILPIEFEEYKNNKRYAHRYSSCHKVRDDGRKHMGCLFPVFLLKDTGKLHFRRP